MEGAKDEAIEAVLTLTTNNTQQQQLIGWNGSQSTVYVRYHLDCSDW